MAEYKVTVNLPNLPPGGEVEVPPIGAVNNGETVTAELTEEQAEWLATNPYIKIGGKTAAKQVSDSDKGKANETEKGGDA